MLHPCFVFHIWETFSQVLKELTEEFVFIAVEQQWCPSAEKWAGEQAQLGKAVIRLIISSIGWKQRQLNNLGTFKYISQLVFFVVVVCLFLCLNKMASMVPEEPAL